MTEGNQFFDDFDKESQSSLFNAMAGVMELTAKQPLSPINPKDNLKISGTAREDGDQEDSDDQCLFFDGEDSQEAIEDLLMRDNSEGTSTTSKAIPEMKVFRISTWTKTNLRNNTPFDLNNYVKEEMEDEFEKNHSIQEKDYATDDDSKDTITPVKVKSRSKSSTRPRRDVTYKTILRKCRKYYQTKFNKVTNFLKRKKKEPCSFYKASILKFIDSWFEFKTNLNVSFHLGCLLYPAEMTRGIESFVYPDGVKAFTPKKVVKRKIETHKQQVDKLHSILYKFTHEKLDKFISIPELAAIFINFIENGAGDDVNKAEFKSEYESLMKRWQKTLSKCKKVRGVATLFD